jgi:hypothetical protein
VNLHLVNSIAEKSLPFAVHRGQGLGYRVTTNPKHEILNPKQIQMTKIQKEANKKQIIESQGLEYLKF